MRVKNLFFGLLLTGTCLSTITSCSNTEEQLISDETPILLKSSLGLQTRSTLQNTQIVSGQKVGISITPTGNSINFLYDNQEIIADGNGGFDYTTIMYYPQTGENIDVYAYHPFNKGFVVSNANTINFVVSDDQTNRTNYLNSDVLFANSINVKRSKNTIPLVFAHKLSKITYTIKKGNGVDISDLNSIILVNALPEIEMNIIDGTLGEASGAVTNLKAFDVKGGTPSDDQLSGSVVILPPQTFEAGNQLLKINIGNTTFTYTPTQNLILESGKNYNFIITLNIDGIIFESTITDWEDGGTIIGEGEID